MSQARSVATGERAANDYALDRVPQDQRRTMWEVTVVRLGQMACLPLFMLGAALGFGMDFWTAFWAIVLGTFILEVVSAIIGIAGAREGLSLYVLARWSGFGQVGSSLIGLVVAISLTGWFGVQNAIFAEGLNLATGGALGLTLSNILAGAFIVLIVVFGFTWLRWTANIAVPAFIVLVVYGIIKLLGDQSLAALVASPPPGPPLSLATGATMVAGAFMVGAVTTPDMTRFMKNSRDVVWMTIIGVTVGELGMGLIAVLMAHAAKSADVVTIMLKLTGALGGFIVIFSTVKINDWNLYSSSLGLTNILHALFGLKANRAVVTIIVGALGTVLSIAGILGQFVPFLTTLGVAIPPIGGIVVVDYFLLKRYRAELDETRKLGRLPAEAEAWNPVALVAWAAGFAAGSYITLGIPSLTSLLASGLVYYAGMLTYKALGQRSAMRFGQVRVAD